MSRRTVDHLFAFAFFCVAVAAIRELFESSGWIRVGCHVLAAAALWSGAALAAGTHPMRGRKNRSTKR